MKLRRHHVVVVNSVVGMNGDNVGQKMSDIVCSEMHFQGKDWAVPWNLYKVG